MMSDPDIFHAARLLIAQYGADASLEATERADWLLEQGDMEGAAVWRWIFAATEELKRGRREGERLN
jgi:hypothetical protein